MRGLRLGLLSVAFLATMQGPHAEEQRVETHAEMRTSNPLLGTWRSSEAGQASVTFITFEADGRYRMRVYFAPTRGEAVGVQVIEGVYTIVRPGRLSFEPRESYACPAGSNCLPVPLEASIRQPQAISFRLTGSASFVESNGTAWQRLR